MNKFKKMRILSGKTIPQVGTETGFKENSIRNWEKGDGLPRADRLPALAKAYNCNIEEFLEMYEKP